VIRANPRHLFIATAMLALAAGPARAEPAAPSPVPAPYPNAPEVAAHKHIGQVKYADYAKSSEGSAATMEAASLELNVEGIAWGKLSDATTVYSADPMEGGQVTARTYHPGQPTYGNVTVDGVASDPEEGGQVSAAKGAKPRIRDMQVTKVNDVASSNLSSARVATAEPGKLEVPDMVAEPLARGTATVKTLAGLCATGKHLVKVKITTRTASYTLHDAIVTSVTPTGDGMDEVSLTYASLGD
jgi:type VI protein secretion system component Hcp